ncbi:putative invertase inhibitor [Impatiens glandulifera]|uniref:putative invertase inhibitor n=1 Tax=Impatiens glandulifera TaxID=253017 RepID=UPI001FB1819D|nr:putative invertase inhibitor [Impatiens glandulifera]
MNQKIPQIFINITLTTILLFIHNVVVKSSHLGGPDMINSTCSQCADTSASLDYNFCQTSLQPIPVSHVTNLPGLGIVAMELSIKNATSTVTAIENFLAGKERLEPFVVACLEDCLELYIEGATMMLDAIGAFYSERYHVANLLVSAAMEGATTCEDGFGEREGVASPLSKQNYDFFQLSDVALCIIKLVTMASRHDHDH